MIPVGFSARLERAPVQTGAHRYRHRPGLGSRGL